MTFVTWMDGMTKNLKWYDISALKLCMLVLGLWLAKLWPPILSLNIWTYFVVWIVLAMYLWYKAFK